MFTKGLIFFSLLMFVSGEWSKTEAVIIDEHAPRVRVYTEDQTEEINCLSRVMFHEGRSEGLIGMIAIAKTAYLRANDGSLCDAIYAPKIYSFTLTPIKKLDQDIENEYDYWVWAMEIAYYIYDHPHLLEKAGIGDRDHYVNPEACLELYGRLPEHYTMYGYKKMRIGRHVFFKSRPKYS